MVFDIVDSYVRNSDAVVSGGKTIDEDKMDILKEYCDILDNMCNDFGGMSVSVDMSSKNLVIISLELSIMTVNRFGQKYYDLIERAILFAVCNTGANDLRVDFTFPSVFTV